MGIMACRADNIAVFSMVTCISKQGEQIGRKLRIQARDTLGKFFRRMQDERGNGLFRNAAGRMASRAKHYDAIRAEAGAPLPAFRHSRACGSGPEKFFLVFIMGDMAGAAGPGLCDCLPGTIFKKRGGNRKIMVSPLN